ncbi:AI-2E family transporter [Ramlibacter sp. XY19]|uniref:AI-2E family transporter n=1 Tax=Ramlibacter paludis TaxID=2908000 RepID=UPI0023DB573F|nr:AI-2E family transporter [Ramlibacter paludis]
MSTDPDTLRDLPPPPVEPSDPPRVLLHMPVDIRSMALVVLTVLAVLAVLRWASAFFIPVMVGLVFSYALSPVVDWLARRRVPRSVSAAVLILGILGGMGGAIYSFSDDANELITSLPQVARKLRDSLHRAQAPARSDSTIDSVQKAAAELQRAADEAGGAAPAQRPGGPTRVIIEKPRFDLREHLWSGTLGLATAVGQTVMVTFLTYFLLISGDTFRRKLVKITGPGLAEKKLTVQALEEINAQMQRYLLVQLLAGLGTGLATGLAFAVIGLNHAAVWGIAAGVLSLVPYIGSTVVTVMAALVAFMQFGDVRSALLVGGSSLVIDTIKGYVIVPWATSKASSMNAVAVFIGVLAWGWLWGVWGLLLGVPILMAIKAVCDRVDHLKPVGELLGS